MLPTELLRLVKFVKVKGPDSILFHLRGKTRPEEDGRGGAPAPSLRFSSRGKATFHILK